jgi:hypothetical protein
MYREGVIMTEQNTSYRANVGHKRDGSLVFVRDSGSCRFFDREYSGVYLRNFMRDFHTNAIAGPYILDPVTIGAINIGLASLGDLKANLQSEVFGGKVLLSLGTNNSLYSLSIPIVDSAQSGGQFCFNGAFMSGDANIIFKVQGVGGSVLGLLGSDLSSINFSEGASFNLTTVSSTEWAIIDRNNSATEFPSG